MTLKRYIPNLITSVRIVGTFRLLFLEPLTMLFYVVYTVSGVSDILDGWIARMTKTTSDFGSKLDSTADLMFYAVMLIQILPILWKVLPLSIWIIAGIMLLIRLISYGIAAWKYHRFSSMHTYLNKLTGACVFAMPYLLRQPYFIGYIWVAATIAMLGTLEELLIHCVQKEYDPTIKSYFNRKFHTTDR